VKKLIHANEVASHHEDEGIMELQPPSSKKVMFREEILNK
jgi:hypothetical protein